MSASTDDPRDIDLPVRWRNWQYAARTEYLTVTLSRADLFRAIVLEVEPEDVDPEDVDEQSRFTKTDLARIALKLGLYRP
ncbi:hypothetical protein EXE53_19650 [Halorubrum sp. SD626R]|uniref:hypothetical protein n=1 Tax=Halorubrum sp. SD626R TaxID=1419722 RepID=UPI0010F61493|nr:hypothetical protein [Halorubrum sp. SD626R]TKX78733.1 hypothetical protein EXE53_19650 [Halorubrum sp. SD626R]